MTILNKLQSWFVMLGAALLVLVGAYAAGGRAAKRSVEIDQARRSKDIRSKARAVDEKIDAMDHSAVRQRAGRWVRAHTKR